MFRHIVAFFIEETLEKTKQRMHFKRTILKLKIIRLLSLSFLYENLISLFVKSAELESFKSSPCLCLFTVKICIQNFSHSTYCEIIATPANTASPSSTRPKLHNTTTSKHAIHQPHLGHRSHYKYRSHRRRFPRSGYEWAMRITRGRSPSRAPNELPQPPADRIT